MSVNEHEASFGQWVDSQRNEALAASKAGDTETQTDSTPLSLEELRVKVAGLLPHNATRPVSSDTERLEYYFTHFGEQRKPILYMTLEALHRRPSLDEWRSAIDAAMGNRRATPSVVAGVGEHAAGESVEENLRKRGWKLCVCNTWVAPTKEDCPHCCRDLSDYAPLESELILS